MEALKQIIEQSFGLRPEHFPPEVQNSVDEVIKLLQQGKLRVAEKIDGEWLIAHETTGLCCDYIRAVCTGDKRFSCLEM